MEYLKTPFSIVQRCHFLEYGEDGMRYEKEMKTITVKQNITRAGILK